MLMHICMLSLAYCVHLSLLVYQNIHSHWYLCCLFPSVCVCVCIRCPLSGSFDLFNASNGTSKEDFSEFDSLRSSSSVPTGTHPCLRHSNDTESVLFFLGVCRSTVSAGHSHVLSLYVNITRPEQRRCLNHWSHVFLKSWWISTANAIKCCSNHIKRWKNSCSLWSGPISVWCNLMQLLCVH